MPKTAPPHDEKDPVKRSLDAEVVAIELQSSIEASGKASPEVPMTPTTLLHTTDVSDPQMSESRRAQLASRVHDALKESKKKTKETDIKKDGKTDGKDEKTVAKVTAAKGTGKAKVKKGIIVDVPQKKAIIDDNHLDPEEEDTSEEEPPTPSESCDEELIRF